jgi:hypothetical protein
VEENQNCGETVTMKILIPVFQLVVVLLWASAAADPYKELVPKYNRTKSIVMARSIDTPTRANLDYAAYNANPIRYDPERQKPKKPARPVGIADMIFKGAVIKTVARIEETPLTPEEIRAPLAWTPLMNLLWTEQKADGLKRIGAAIIGEKWNDPEIFKPYQEIAALYLHPTRDKVECWVRIEFMPWVTFLQGIDDADRDGFKEVYGLLNTGGIDAAQLKASVDWIGKEYCTRLLSREEIVDWANVLASYWYPTLNTDIVNMGGAKTWPLAETEKKVRRSLKKQVFENPVAIIRGEPYDKVLYNVFIVKRLTEKKNEISAPLAVADQKGKVLDTAISANFRENNKRFAVELKPYGDYPAWLRAVAPLQDGFRQVLAALPRDQMGIVGRDGWLFFRKSVDYILAPDLSLQPPEKNPLPHLKEFKAFLEGKKINFLFVAVPCKEELYSEELGITTTDATGAIVAPYGRKMLADLQKNGIEVIDLLPRFLEAEAADALSTKPVYQKQDTHWTNRGLQIAADLIADRIKQYSWYDACESQKKSYTVFDTTFLRQGDIVERIPEAARINYAADTLDARQIVTPEGKKYKSDPAGPVMLIGDSFTGVFELVDCKSAGIGANIAQKTGLPVDILTGWGGGPMIMNKMVRIKKNTLDAKRLVICMMTARDLYDYSLGWEKLTVE